MVLLDAASQRGHAPRAAERAWFPARLLSSQERGLERQHALSAQIVVRERIGKTADLLCDGSRQQHGRDRRGGNALRGCNRCQPMAARRELSFYSTEYARTGFQGGLQWYRCGTSGAFTAELETFSGRTIDVPSCFISGKQDWGTYQRPRVFEAMQASACTQMIGCHLVEGAGHWVQQEQPEQVSRLLLQFVKQAREREP